MSEEFFIQGNEACAKGALKAGCRFFAGYPITPSTEIIEMLGELLFKWKMKLHQQVLLLEVHGEDPNQ